MEKKYRFLDHTADVALEVYGNSKTDLFLNSLEALSVLLVEKAGGKSVHKEIVLEADTWEDLLVAWLNELIFYFFTFSFLSGAALPDLEDKGGKKRLKASVQGIEFDPEKTKINLEVKAATYHNVHIVHDDKGYSVTIVFDV